MTASASPLLAVEAMRAGLGVHSANDASYRPLANRDNDYLMDREAQRRGDTYSGIKGIALQDASLQESMGPIVDRTKERLVATDAGIIKAEVVLISKKSEAAGEPRWVYLDIGKFGGLAETMDEAIRYPIRTTHDRDAKAQCIVAGPTCDSVDVLYEKVPYDLPVSLSIGDEVLIEGTGAYTTTYSAVAFNGFPPLKSYVI